MCDNATQEIELTEDQLAELMEMTAEENNSEIKFIFEPVEFDEELVMELFETKEALDGKAVGAYFGGMYSTLINMGCEASLASKLTLSQQEILASEKANAVSLEVAKVQSSNNIEL